MPIATTPPSLATSVVDRFARALRRRYGNTVLEVRLFGSFARGEADEESDLDVAVVLETADWERRREVIDLATDTGLPHGLLVSPTVFDRDTWETWRRQERALVRDIEREGVPF